MVAVALHRSPFARARWLVLAPHADDETLGAGALIHEVASAGRLAAVAFLTDGAGSHAHDDERSRTKLVRMRRSEARLAVQRLTGRAAIRPVFLGWPDAAPWAADSPSFETTQSRLSSLCRRGRVDAIAVTAECETHCDHQGAFRLATAVCRSAGRPIALFEYHVWSEARLRPRTLQTQPMATGLRQHALRAHRSQLTAAFGPGFRLPAHMVRMQDRDFLTLRDTRNAT